MLLCSVAALLAGAAPVLDMLQSQLAGKPAVDHEVLLALSQNYCSEERVWALEWSTAKQLGGNSFTAHSVVYASLAITLENQLPDVQLLYNSVTGISNYTQLLDYYESVILRYLNDASYTWENTWAYGGFPGEGETMLALHAGLFVHLYRRFGASDYAFVQRFVKTVSQLSSRCAEVELRAVDSARRRCCRRQRHKSLP
jgi:hypothetical protein